MDASAAAVAICYTSSNDFRIPDGRMLFTLYVGRLCVFWYEAIAKLDKV
jgi:hypothetical protein